MCKNVHRTTFEIAKNWPPSKSPWAQEWINNNDVFKQPKRAVKMNSMLREKNKLRKHTAYDSIYKKFKNRQNKQCVV